MAKKPSGEAKRTLGTYRRFARLAMTGMALTQKTPPLPGQPLKMTVSLAGHMMEYGVTKKATTSFLGALANIQRGQWRINQKGMQKPAVFHRSLLDNLDTATMLIGGHTPPADTYHGDRKTFRDAVDIMALYAMSQQAEPGDKLFQLAAKGLWLNSHFGAVKDTLYKKRRKAPKPAA